MSGLKRMDGRGDGGFCGRFMKRPACRQMAWKCTVNKDPAWGEPDWRDDCREETLRVSGLGRSLWGESPESQHSMTAVHIQSQALHRQFNLYK